MRAPESLRFETIENSLTCVLLVLIIAPFPPLAAFTATSYQESEFRRSDGSVIGETFQQRSISQYALAPIALGRRDAIVVGEWLSWTRLEPGDSGHDDLEVLSASVAVGWLRQASADWQFAGFIAPLGHRTHEDGWYWETLGGVFARLHRKQHFAWALPLLVHRGPPIQARVGRVRRTETVPLRRDQ